MATYKVRGTAHNIIYTYRTEAGETKQQWETYVTELEAKHRKAYIDYLQKSNLDREVMKAALEYRRKKAVEKAINEQFQPGIPELVTASGMVEDNMGRKYAEFVEKWLPFHARKNRFSPNSYDSYRQNLNNHILPYFGNRVMSKITAEDIDSFLDHLSKKPCKGHKSYGKLPCEIPTLSSSTIKKCYIVLMSGFRTAKKWNYITEIPDVTAPLEKTQKRRAWDQAKVSKMLESIQDDKLLHLAVHIAFVCSLRAGEVAGLDLNTIDFRDGSLWITRQLQRVSDTALNELPKNEIIRIFPKQVTTAKSSLILKGPKTEGSKRKQYLTEPLLREIKEQLEQIEEHKSFFLNEYHDYGLLLCHNDGRPLDPKSLEKGFKEHQVCMKVEEGDRIDFQGLRKSGQMHKVRLSQNNFQLVAENAGQSPEVLMSNYNEALDSEKRALSRLVEGSFYPRQEHEEADADVAAILEKIQQDPELARQLMQNLLLSAV